jgi:hypothetical protein
MRRRKSGPPPISRAPRGRALALAALLLPGVARADDAKPAAWETAPATWRGSFVAGAEVGFGLASVAGYPNDVKKIGFASYYTATGARPASIVEAWVGVALTDWITFAIGLGGTPLYATGTDKARTVAGVFHIEAFPLFYVRPRLRDLGVTFEAGTGVTTVTDSTDTTIVASSAASFIGGGLFWEPLHTWRIHSGPFLLGDYMWSDTVRRPAIFVGFRASLYTGP